MRNPTEHAWLVLWSRLGARGNPRAFFNNLAAHYSNPNRAYHTLAHVMRCLDEFKEARHLAENPDAVELAIWYHDAIYDPRATDNENQSAALVVEMIKAASLPDSLQKTVANLIVSTSHAFCELVSSDAKLLVDIDLTILGQPEEVFDEYERQIRTEYGWVPEGLFTAGRRAILKSFLDRPSVFQTDFFQAKYEAQARRNITHSLANLTNS